MSLLFSSIKAGPLTIPNRFMRSPCCEALAGENGIAPPKLLKYIEKLAKGNVGLIIPGYVYVAKRGQSLPGQTGLATQEQANVWRDTIGKVHQEGSKIIFQICHGGSFLDPALANHERYGVSDGFLHPESREMTITEIEDTINDFINSAKLAKSIGADGVQIHGAHAYLLSSFLSPYQNRRKDQYGGSDENRLRFVQEIATSIKKTAGEDFAVAIKMNGIECIDGGTTPELASKYVRMLKDIDLFEISGGISSLTIIRSKPIKSFYKNASINEINEYVNSQKGNDQKYPYKELYHLDAAKLIKKENPDKVIASVGGIRKLTDMEMIVKNNYADLISMGRPFFREPYLVKEFKSGKKIQSSCISCGECILRTPGKDGVKCYFPSD